MTQAKVTPTANNTAIGLKTKGYDKDQIIDPANQKDVDEVVSSGGTLTDKVQSFNSLTPNKFSHGTKKSQRKA